MPALHKGTYDPSFISHLVLTGSTVLATTALRGLTRGVTVCIAHAPSMTRLLREVGSGALEPQAELRDEVLHVWRELASISWQEARLAVDKFDAHTRRQHETEDEPTRRHRVKP